MSARSATQDSTSTRARKTYPLGIPLPGPRGPLSDALLTVLACPVGLVAPVELNAVTSLAGTVNSPLIDDEDVQMALLCLQALRYRGLAGVEANWERDATLFQTTQILEAKVLAEAAARFTPQPSSAGSGADAVRTVLSMAYSTSRSTLSTWLASDLSRGTMRELFIHQSLEHLRSPYLFLSILPRISGFSTEVAALLERAGLGSADAADRVARFAEAMRAVGLTDRLGWYIEALPASTLCGQTTVEMFANQQVHLGATVGHLVASSAADEEAALNGDYMLRLGFDASVANAVDRARRNVHIPALLDLADIVINNGIVTCEDVILGAATSLGLRDIAQERMLRAWQGGKSSLRSCPMRPSLDNVGA